MGFRGSAADVGRGVARVGVRATVAVSSAALFLGAAGCSSGSSADPDEEVPADNALSKIDPCSIIKPEKATQVGLPTRGEPEEDGPHPGCFYSGDNANIGVHRAAEDNLDELGNRSVWSEFKPLKVNGRDGAEAHLPDEPEDECTTAISAGGGVVMVNASAADPRKPFDGCAESLKVAKLIEPDLPK